MAQFAVWHGSEAEMVALLRVVDHNCDCPRGHAWDERRPRCGAHLMLAFDQRTLDGLLFVAQIVDRLRAEEWSGSAESPRIDMWLPAIPAVPA